MSMLAEREMKTNYEVFNIGRNDPIPTPELAKKIVALTGSHSNIVTIDPIKTIIHVKRASFEKIKRELGWEAKTDIDTGLKGTLKWLQSSKSAVPEQYGGF
jgi:nucleoside-diphosphate-sugar epimerase